MMYISSSKVYDLFEDYNFQAYSNLCQFMYERIIRISQIIDELEMTCDNEHELHAVDNVRRVLSQYLDNTTHVCDADTLTMNDELSEHLTSLFKHAVNNLDRMLV